MYSYNVNLETSLINKTNIFIIVSFIVLLMLLTKYIRSNSLKISISIIGCVFVVLLLFYINQNGFSLNRYKSYLKKENYQTNYIVNSSICTGLAGQEGNIVSDRENSINESIMDSQKRKSSLIKEYQIFAATSMTDKNIAVEIYSSNKRAKDILLLYKKKVLLQNRTIIYDNISKDKEKIYFKNKKFEEYDYSHVIIYRCKNKIMLAWSNDSCYEDMKKDIRKIGF